MMSIVIRLIFILLTLYHVYAANSVSTAKEECRKRIAECTMNGGANTPVCGSDSVTYPSQCQVISRQCQGVAILIKHIGPCPETPPCFSARLTARPGSQPVCRPDGTYASVQCHIETGYCWCVTPQGRPLPDTSVKHERPRCGLKLLSRHHQGTKASNTPFIRSGHRIRSSSAWKHRRQYSGTSSIDNDSNNSSGVGGARHHRNTCDRAEKMRFNQNLIENFKIEYRRANVTADGDENVERVLLWKFVTLDKDSNGYLDQMEYKELRRLAKKAVKPKKCARTFARTCDLDRDSKLSIQEWSTCLANDFTLLRNSPAPVHARPAFNDDPPDTKEESNANDCISDRRSVMEDQKQNSQEKFYIPQCTPDGRYHKVQCYSGYCWCVYQDTGKPIPGTSSKERNPNCNPAPTPSRPIKGCPESRKQVFLRDLMDLMQQEMKSSIADSEETNVKWQAPKEERIATWHFVMLDKNKNKVLERKEWKTFRTMVGNNKQLRKCGRKLPRYCDINNDRRISMTEWLSCLNAQRLTTGESLEKSPTTKPRRMGPNPLDQFLNDD